MTWPRYTSQRPQSPICPSDLHLIAIVSDLPTLFGAFRSHLNHVFAPFMYLDFKETGGVRAVTEKTELWFGAAPKVLIEQVLQVCRAGSGGDHGQRHMQRQHRRRHSDPEGYRGTFQPPMPSFPAVLLPTSIGTPPSGNFWNPECLVPAVDMRN